MNTQADGIPILHYVIEIEDREFLLVILSDGTSQWDDHTGRRRIRHPRDQHLELRSFTGERRAFDQLESELLEFTISAPIPEKIVTKAMEMAQKEQDGETKTRRFQRVIGKTSKDIAEMDRLFEDFFWREVNPRLKQPLVKPRK